MTFVDDLRLTLTALATAPLWVWCLVVAGLAVYFAVEGGAEWTAR